MKNDIAYSIIEFTPDGEAYPERWAEAALEYRALEANFGRARLNDAYGEDEREKIDFFHPQGAARGLVFFVHGGYWMRFGREYFSHLAAGATARDWLVAMPSYTLAPEARISEITAQVAQALIHAASRVSGPIRLVGHSAGGHLVARLICDDIGLPEEVRERIAHVMSISPVGDLRPLLETTRNEVLGLDAEEAQAESPALHARPNGVPAQVPVTVWVAADERPVFVEQARNLAASWDGAELIIESGKHHLDVIDSLVSPDSRMVRKLLDP